MSLGQVVELFRLAGKPPVAGGRFSTSIAFDKGVGLVRSIRAQHGNWFDDIAVDGVDVFDDDPIPSTGHIISFEVHLPTSSATTFHQNISALIAKARQISRGDCPGEFYLVDEDYYTGDTVVPEIVTTLRAICELITGLKHLAFHDKETPQGYLSLVFVQPSSDNNAKPVVIETLVDEDLLFSAKGLSPILVTGLAKAKPENDPHYIARSGVFGVTLAGFVNKREPDVQPFAYLVRHWNEFNAAYHDDLGTYLSGFAFHKAKKEVAQAEIDIASQLSKVISDISGKLLSIPLSFAAIATIPKTDGMLQSWIVVFGILLAAVIISGVIGNQSRHFRRVKHAKVLVLNAIQGKKRDYPDDLRNAVDEMTKELNKNEASLGRLLILFKILCWAPVVLALVVHSYFYSHTAHKIILCILDWF